MTALISINDALAWVEVSKIGASFTAVDANLEPQVSGETIGELASFFDVSSWVDSFSTPLLVRRIIAMRYVAWILNKLYSDNEELSAYAVLLLANADILLANILNGTIIIPGLPDGSDLGTNVPGYYPTDESSSMCPTYDDSSLGPAVFSMGRIW